MNVFMKHLVISCLVVTTMVTLVQAQTQPELTNAAVQAPMPTTAATPVPPVDAASAPKSAKKPAANRAKSAHPTAAPASAQKPTPEAQALRYPPPSQLTKDMYRAYKQNNLELVDMLIQQGADINCPNCELPPLLLYSIWQSRNLPADSISWMLARGGNPNVTWAQGGIENTALMEYIWSDSHQPHGISLRYGSGEENLATLKRLLDAGGDAQAKTVAGDTLLHLLSQDVFLSYPEHRQYFTRYLDLLLARGLDINAVDSLGQTPLWVAVSKVCDVDLVRVYQQRGADLSIKAKDGTGLRDLAYKAAVGGDVRCNALMAYLSHPADATKPVSVSTVLSPAGSVNPSTPASAPPKRMGLGDALNSLTGALKGLSGSR